MLKTKTFCLGILARVLAWVGKQLHTALDKLNGTWYRFHYTVLLKYQSGQIKQQENCCQLPMLGF